MPTRTFTIAVLLALTGCGGGTSRESSSPQQQQAANQAPVAHVVAQDVVASGARVILDGSESFDADGDISSFSWAQTDGEPVLLVDSRSAVASFVAPTVTRRATLGFRLSVADQLGAEDARELAVTVVPRQLSLSGTIIPVPGTAIDSDVNDPDSSLRLNDAPEQAQPLNHPATVAGYVNVAGAGAAGRSRIAGDSSDFFRIRLSARQGVSLIVADPAAGDPDLYLWDATGSAVLEASVGTGAREYLDVPADGEYLIEVSAYGGATNYLLLVGQTSRPVMASDLSLADEFMPGEVLVEREAGAREITGTAAAAVTAGDQPARLPLAVPERLRLDGVAGMASAASTDGSGHRVGSVPAPLRREKLRTLLAIKALRGDASVAWAQPNFRVLPQWTPSDPLYPLQWHYPMIDLPSAWDFTRGDSGVTVAVVDSGVLPAHPDLQGRLLPGYDFVSGIENAADGDGIDADPTDPGDGGDGGASSFHGTHVAGTVAALGGNLAGGTGVAPGVRIRPVRSLGVAGGSSYDIIQGVRYAAGLTNDSGRTVPAADVINLSLGRRGRCWPSEQAAFDAARQAGVVVVAAAGNDGIDAADAFPANCRHVMAVGAVNRSGDSASYSNHGVHVDVLAPGGEPVDRDGDGDADGVLSLGADDSAPPTRHGYGFKHGTSMASAHVAGVVALMRSVNPLLTPQDVDRLLADGALTDERGLIDAYRAVQAALGLPVEAPLPGSPLAASPAALDFGVAYTYAEIEISRDGGSGAVAATHPSSGWLQVRPVDVDAEGLGTYGVTVDRSVLRPGSYDDTVVVEADGQRLEIPVTLQVRSAPGQAQAGHLYVLLTDATTGQVVRQTALSAADGVYRYHFDDLEYGRYILFAGSDVDNDQFICDAGETCGAFPSIGGTAEIVVDADVRDVDFGVGPMVSVPGYARHRDRGVIRAASTREERSSGERTRTKQVGG